MGCKFGSSTRPWFGYWVLVEISSQLAIHTSVISIQVFDFNSIPIHFISTVKMILIWFQFNLRPNKMISIPIQYIEMQKRPKIILISIPIPMHWNEISTF